MTLDTMAHHYGLLPSEVLERATTFDLQIMDVAQSYRNYLQQKSRGITSPPDLSEDHMLTVISQMRGEKK